MRASVFVSVVLLLSGFGDVFGQSPKDEKLKGIKEIAVARVLGELDRLLAQRAEARNLLSAMEKGEVYSPKEKQKATIEKAKLGLLLDQCSRTADGTFHFSDERAKSSCVTAQKERAAVLEKKLAGLKTGMLPLPIFSLSSMVVGDAGLIGVYYVRIRQIIDENQMLVEWSSDPPFLAWIPTGRERAKNFRTVRPVLPRILQKCYS